jgi:type I restriction enzyme S subunit
MKRWEIDDAEDKITPDAVKNSATNLIPPNSILVVNRSGILKHTLPVGITRRSVAINQDLKALVCNERAYPEYIAHVVKAAEPIVLKWVRATTADNFSIENLRSLEISLPSLDEQRRIAAILDKAKKVRRKSQEALFLADQLGHALYRNSFGDPVSNLTRLPITTIGQLGVEMVYGPRFYNEEYSETGIRIVRITDLSESGELDFEAMPRLAVAESELRNHQSRPGELLFARTGAT